jgi:sugar-specific transcriptional regulator TrmB
MMTNSTLTSFLNEKDVEHFYRQLLTKKFGDIEFNSPLGCDGYGESKKHHVRLLCEFKFDLDLTSKVNQVKVLCQALYYIKKFELSGKLLPSVILIADRNECFAIHTNEIFNYLGMDFNWSLAPSNAHTNIELVSLMIEDSRINPHVFNIKDIADCVDKIKDLTDGVKRLIPITPHNVTEVFKHFEEKVIGKHKLDTNQMANLFVQLLVNPDENYLHPVTRRKTVVTKAFNEVNLKSREAFTSFFSHFSNEYSPKQRENLTAVVDRLVQDVTRRKQGEFFTPSIWVDKAHEYIASVFGEDWKEKYVVWDPAWGTGNLTRDYKFKELYVSTLVYADIETANQMGYNPEATKFQYDFLNDQYEFLPKGLRDAIESGREIIVLMNPPYATSTDMRNTSNNKTIHKSGTSQTLIYEKMITDGYGKGSEQLYSQFIYRINNLGHCHIAMFSKPLFISGPTFSIFREKTLINYNFKKGFLMNSSHFADVKSWGLIFSILEKNKSKNDFIFDILDVLDFEIVKISDKKIYDTEKSIPLSDWVRQEIKNYNGPKTNLPHLSSGLKVVNKNVAKEISQNYLGSYIGLGNNVQRNDRGVTILSSTGVQGNAKVSLSIVKENFHKIIISFTSRKLIDPNWVNEKDEYFAPNENSELFSQFKSDSIIYALFNNSSEQSSLRQITYKDQLWDIKNQFFWMSKEEMTNLANNNNYTELYNDARTDSDRYVYNLLFGEQRIYDQLSEEAKNVLDCGTNLVRLSFGMRRNFADDTNHLNSWDAGYAQLKLLWKEYYPEQFKEFRDKYKILEEKMRPMVYELGFLLK